MVINPFAPAIYEAAKRISASSMPQINAASATVLSKTVVLYFSKPSV
jgi:hypothetical protein